METNSPYIFLYRSVRDVPYRRCSFVVDSSKIPTLTRTQLNLFCYNDWLKFTTKLQWYSFGENGALVCLYLYRLFVLLLQAVACFKSNISYVSAPRTPVTYITVMA